MDTSAGSVGWIRRPGCEELGVDPGNAPAELDRPVPYTSDMALGNELVARIERTLDLYGRGRPIPATELRARLDALGVVADEDFAEFVGRWGGCFVGVSVHAWDNADLIGRETCIELTTWARDAYGALIDGVVFADDGSGNPIWIAADGSVCLVDHDNANTVVRLAASFRELLDENVDAAAPAGNADTDAAAR